MRNYKDQPSFVKDYPQTPLAEKLEGKKYPHEGICSASRYKPIGEPGCICLRRLRRGDTRF